MKTSVSAADSAKICPAVFQLGDDGVSHVMRDKCAEAGCCEDAADECPVDAISLAED